jgi:hypothetical protein
MRERVVDTCRIQPVQQIEKPLEHLRPDPGIIVIHGSDLPTS